MRIRLVVSVALIATFALAVSAARGEWHQAVGRYLGIGWGDGYHARTNCPPKHGKFGTLPPAPVEKPWWAIPAADTEPLPHPAATRQTGEDALPIPSGQSLFRRPGEASPIITTDRAAARR